MPDQPNRPSQWDRVDKSTEILNVRSEVMKHRGWLGSAVDRVGQFLASPSFFAGLLGFHVLWIVLNLPIYPYRPWDPYPFTFLATLASVEAPFLSLMILMRQQRDSHIAELREEIQLQVSLHLERQSTMVLRLLDRIGGTLRVESHQDPELLDHMKEFLDPHVLLEHLRRHLSTLEGEETTES